MLRCDDVLRWAAEYEGEPFHALLCDPPYHLTDPRNPARAAAKSPEERKSKGFMQMSWDGGRVAFEPETWSELAQHLHPGAFGMAFASSRGWHRMAVAIEDAGLIIHPVILCWAFGSGFPKATRIDTQIDSAAGQPGVRTRGVATRHGLDFHMTRGGGGYDPATPLRAAWQGHRYGLQALKPALEPIIVFQRPYEGRAVDCIARSGAGALNIDAGRIGTQGGGWLGNASEGYGGGFAPAVGWKRNGGGLKGGAGVVNASAAYDSEAHDLGRWPSNFTLVHHPACNGVCHEDCPARRLGEQSGTQHSTERRSEDRDVPGATYTLGRVGVTTRGHADAGTAARYFYNADWMLDRLEASDPVGYFAKASRAEREAGLDPLLLALLGEDTDEFSETTVDDGRQTPIDNPYLRGETTRRNTHPTIKPLSLTRWLASLLLPPDAYAPRRLLVPFAGTGSEMIGGLLAGWEDIEGLELDAEHVRIGHVRLAYRQQQKHKFDQGQPITLQSAPMPSVAQRGLFDD